MTSNKKTIIAPPGDEPMSLDELLTLFKVDKSVWKVDRFLPNSWPIGAKLEEKDIEFVDGVMTGYVKSSGEISTKRLYQAKAWLSRRELVPSKVPIHTVEVRIRKPKVRKPRKKKVKQVLVLPDPQFGFLKEVNKPGAIPLHDRAALDAVYQVALEINPDSIVWAGDILDLSEWSTHFVLRPEFQMTTQAALVEAAWNIGLFKAGFPFAEHVAMIGNHDNRLEQYMIRNMKQAYAIRPADQMHLGSMMEIDNLLGLSRMGVHYVGKYPDGEWWLNEYLKVVHGAVARLRPGATASAIIQNSTVNQIFGHIHRQEIVSERIVGKSEDRPIWAASSGCLCCLDGRVPGSTKDRNWQQGAMLVQYDASGFVGFPEFIRIHDDTAIFRGNSFKGQDRFEDLAQATTGQFDWDAYKPVPFI